MSIQVDRDDENKPLLPVTSWVESESESRDADYIERPFSEPDESKPSQKIEVVRLIFLFFSYITTKMSFCSMRLILRRRQFLHSTSSLLPEHFVGSLLVAFFGT